MRRPAGGGASIPAQDTILQIDPAQTKVEFTLGDVLHTVHGTFRLKRGSMRFDPATGKAVGRAGGGRRQRRERQRRARPAHAHQRAGERPLSRDRLPPRPRGRRVAPEGTSQVRLHGMFAIHGAEHEITMPATVQAIEGGYSATAHFWVPYVKWGMKNPSTLFLRVNDKVEIVIHTVAKAAR